MNSVSPQFDVGSVERTMGAIDGFDFVDAYAGQTPHLRAFRVPLGAPLVVGGWALDPSGLPCAAVTMVIDSVLRFAAGTGFSRRDVVIARGPGTPEFSGFRSVLTTSDLVPGPHEVRAYALAADGAWYEAGHQGFWVFDIVRPELGMLPRAARIVVDGIDCLTEQGAFRGTNTPVPLGHVALIRGWAIDLATSRGPTGVCAMDESGRSWSTSCELVRSDVRGVVPSVVDDRLGFEIAIPTNVLGRGRHRLSVVAFDAEGRRFARPAEAEIDVAAPARSFPAYAREAKGTPECAVLLRCADGNAVVLDAWSAITAVRGEIFDIAGWAIAADGTASTDLFIELHHPEQLGIPPYRHFPIAGFRRDKTPRELRAPRCEDAWFTYRLGTADLARRTYDLALAIVSADRRSYVRRALGMLTIRGVPD